MKIQRKIWYKRSNITWQVRVLLISLPKEARSRRWSNSILVRLLSRQWAILKSWWRGIKRLAVTSQPSGLGW